MVRLIERGELGTCVIKAFRNEGIFLQVKLPAYPAKAGRGTFRSMWMKEAGQHEKENPCGAVGMGLLGC